ncbi:uncharacterized protein ARMOST_20454 [Armillaria ostoyae]|uniref:Uncharacterized protein n=1 Tax=Armillaria ostoyae TaxID=47428 RepID=A0A284S7D7_ARMOS|nr:uncharacterized protein ARMOST_20454 [Armillaria ostoyae]
MENHTLDLSSYDDSHARGRRLLVPTGMMTETSRGAFQSSERSNICYPNHQCTFELVAVLMYVRSATGPSLLLGTVRDQGESTIDATFTEIFISQCVVIFPGDFSNLEVITHDECFRAKRTTGIICTDSELLASWLLKPAVWFSLTDDSVMNGYACHRKSSEPISSPPPRQLFSLSGQENSAFDICVHAFNCVRLRLREFNLHMFVDLSMHLDVRYPDSQYHFNDTG